MDNILLMSLGSRGDMEPFLALGEELQQAGHEIAYCMPAQFQSLAQQVSPNFYPMTPDFLALMDDPEVKKITGQIGSGWSRLKTIFKLLKSTKPLQQQLIRDQKAACDAFEPALIIYHIKCVYPVIAALRKAQRVELLSPVPCLLHAVDHEPAIGFGTPRGRRWNRWTYSLANSALIKQAILGYGNPVLKDWGWPILKQAELKTFLLEKLPVEYAVSERLFPQPIDWPAHVKVTDYRERNKSKNWTPPTSLTTFLEAHPNPLYIGFGSMINGQPKQVGADILSVAQTLDLPVIINTSWGGIEIEGEVPDHVYIIDDVPFDWLFARVRAVVHHGGSGTTHSALRFDVPQLIIPHIADQFLWMRLIIKNNIGPAGFPIKNWSKEKFEQGVRALLQLD